VLRKSQILRCAFALPEAEKRPSCPEKTRNDGNHCKPEQEHRQSDNYLDDKFSHGETIIAQKWLNPVGSCRNIAIALIDHTGGF